MKIPYLTIAYHIVAWSILLFLLINSSISWGWTLDSKLRSDIPHFYGVITNALIFYITAYFIVPKYFAQGKNYRFVLNSIIFLLSFSLLEVYLDYQLGQGLNTRSYLGTISLNFYEKLLEGMAYALPVNASFYFFALAYRLPIDRKKAYEREINLVRENYNTELKFLKSQIHPHTLFNGMNGIYHLIDVQPEKAKQMLLSLSNALRYHLYESSTDFVEITKEIKYIEEYVAFNRLRLEEDISFEMKIKIEEAKGEIAPLLLTPFIENAFKYVSRYVEKEKNFINISLLVQHSALLFHISNSSDNKSLGLTQNGGIGLDNIKNRLELLYEQNFELEITESKDQFIVDLKVPIRKSK